MFSWGNKAASPSLVETLGLNTLKYREKRDNQVKSITAHLFNAVIKDIIDISLKSIAPDASFDLSNEDLQKKVTGLNSVSVQERTRILESVAARLKEEEKLETCVSGAVLTVKWTIPVVVVPASTQELAPVVVPASTPVAQESAPVFIPEQTEQVAKDQ